MSEQQAQPTQPHRARRNEQGHTRSGQTYTHGSRTVTVPDGYLAVGYVQGIHGLRGELRVDLYTDFPERFAPGIHLYLGEELEEVEVVGARLHKQLLLLRLADVESREDADALRGEWLFIREDDAAELEEGIFWIHDIVGMAVQSDEGLDLGVVREVLFTGANDVYIVETPPTINQGRDLLLPAIEEVVRSVDVEAKQMIVHLLPGLLEA
jgi:16S rRNA processing protein RimM